MLGRSSEDPALVVQLPGSREARSGPAHGGERRGRSPRAASPRISASPVTHSQHTGPTADATVYNWTHMATHHHASTPPHTQEERPSGHAGRLDLALLGARDRPAARGFRSGSPGPPCGVCGPMSLPGLGRLPSLLLPPPGSPLVPAQVWARPQGGWEVERPQGPPSWGFSPGLCSDPRDMKDLGGRFARGAVSQQQSKRAR